jgi:hypothetical protein
MTGNRTPAIWPRNAWLLLVAVALAFSAALYVQGRWRTVSGPPPLILPDAPGGRLTVSELSEKRLTPMVVDDAAQLRWRDIGDVAYAPDFRRQFAYENTGEHFAEVEYEPSAHTLVGRVSVRGLKPWFVYQIKLVGPEPIAGLTEADNSANPGVWSSYQLGRMGRWWCEDCRWNVADAELAEHLANGHDVRGYVLFDWLLTDGEGDADHEFALDRSLHVLWKVGQRDRGEHDSAPRWYAVERSGDAYDQADRAVVEEVAVFAEWEPTRAAIGDLVVPSGEYRVRFNLTEESWHANLGDREQELGGQWAWVLDADLLFTVDDEPVRISRAR